MEQPHTQSDSQQATASGKAIFLRQFMSAVGEFTCWVIVAYALIFRFQTSLLTEIPQGQENAATVPLFNLFTIVWNAVTFGRSNYWHAPIFFPTGGALAFSEVQPTSLLVAPIVGRSPVLAYNVYLLASVAFSSLLIRRWLTCLRLAWPASVLGGVFVLLLPFLHGELGVLQLTMLWGPIAFAYSIHRLWKSPGIWSAVICGVAFAAMYASCHYYGMMVTCLFVLLLPGFAIHRILTWRATTGRHAAVREISCCLLAVFVAAALLFPLLQGQLKWMAHSKPRELSTVRGLSCYADDWLRTKVTSLGTIPEQWMWKGPRDSRPMGVSLGAMLLAAWGAVIGIRRRENRSITMALLSVLLASFLLSLGPRLSVAGFEPYSYLFEHAPFLKYLRSPFRFAVFGQLAITMLMAFAVDGSISHGKTIRMNWRRLQRVLLSLLLISFLAESWPKPSLRCEVDPGWLHPAKWTTWLQSKVDPGRPVLCLPFPFDKHVREFEPATQWMLAATVHQRPMVGGYSGYFPASFRVAQAKLRLFPSEETYDYLRTTGIEYALIRADLWPQMPLNIQELPVALVDDEAGVMILKLSRSE